MSKLRWVWYGIVGICFAAAVVFISVHFPGWNETAIQSNLLSIAISTVGVFGYVLNWAWRYRKSVRFWIAFMALLLVHCAVFVLLSFYVNHWPIVLLGVLSGVEIMGLAVTILYVMNKTLDWQKFSVLFGRSTK